MNDVGPKSEQEYRRYLAEARRQFANEDREASCRWYAKARLHERPDAETRDLADFLVTAVEYRPELAGDVARLLLTKKDLTLVYLQDVYCCALSLQDRELEQNVTDRVHTNKLTPNICARIADIYYQYGTTDRDAAKAVFWLQRAASADAAGFSDWAAKAGAYYIVVENEEKAELAILGCAQRALELASVTPEADADALQDLLEALNFVRYDGGKIVKALCDRLLANTAMPLPDKHRIWQDLKGMGNNSDD